MAGYWLLLLNSLFNWPSNRFFERALEGHPDQIPCILVWEDLVTNPPPWVSLWESALVQDQAKKNVHTDTDTDLLLLNSPPPYPLALQSHEGPTMGLPSGTADCRSVGPGRRKWRNGGPTIATVRQYPMSKRIYVGP